MSKGNKLLLVYLTGLVVTAVAMPSARWLPEGRPIPVQRVIRNLENRLKSDRRNADLLTNLARLQAYTFATKRDTALQTRDGLFEPDPFTDLPGRELQHLALWRDANINGVSEPGEVTPLDYHGIVALSCRHILVSEEDSTVAAYSLDGVRYRDGSTRPTYDLVLRAEPYKRPALAER